MSLHLSCQPDSHYLYQARLLFSVAYFALQSTLFNAIVENGKAAAANFPFCTIEPNVGMVTVPDARLQELSKISKSKEIVSSLQVGAAYVLLSCCGY